MYAKQKKFIHKNFENELKLNGSKKKHYINFRVDEETYQKIKPLIQEAKLSDFLRSAINIKLNGEV